MANVDDEFSPGYDGAGTPAGEWFVVPELCKGLMLKGALRIVEHLLGLIDKPEPEVTNA